MICVYTFNFFSYSFYCFVDDRRLCVFRKREKHKNRQIDDDGKNVSLERHCPLAFYVFLLWRKVRVLRTKNVAYIHFKFYNMNNINKSCASSVRLCLICYVCNDACLWFIIVISNLIADATLVYGFWCDDLFQCVYKDTIWSYYMYIFYCSCLAMMLFNIYVCAIQQDVLDTVNIKYFIHFIYSLPRQ